MLALGLATAGAATTLASSQPAESARAKTYLLGATGKLRVKPTRKYAGTRTVLRKLRWKRWGTGRAVARGELYYADAYPSRRFTAPVRVTAYRLGRCGAKRTYKRIRVRLVRSSDRRKYNGVAGSEPTGCKFGG